VTSEELVFAPHWSHQLCDLKSKTEIYLHNGLHLDSDEIGVVFNRLRYVFLPHFENASPDDRDYAIMEMYALWLSWLASLPCRVINSPSPRGLGAKERSQMEWLYLARQAGLPVQGYFFTSDPRRYNCPSYKIYKRTDPSNWMDRPVFQEIPAHTAGRQPAFYLEPLADAVCNVLVAGDHTIGPLATEFNKELRMLTSLSACDLLCISFAPRLDIDSDCTPVTNNFQNWKVSHISAFPQVEDTMSILAIVTMLESASLHK
jgi:hypothetical protein